MVDHCVHEHEPYTTAFILSELQKVFREKEFRFAGNALGSLLEFINRFYILGQTAKSADKVCRDPNDDQILADALINRVDVIITGDKDLLDLKKYKAIRLLAPKDYWML